MGISKILTTKRALRLSANQIYAHDQREKNLANYMKVIRFERQTEQSDMAVTTHEFVDFHELKSGH